MNDLAPYKTVTEDEMKRALIEARGDIFIGSQLLGITAIRLTRAIRVSAHLQTVALTLAENVSSEFAQKSTADLEAAVRTRLSLYRVAGLDSLYELATMPIDENSAQNQVRLAAAARLAGSTEGAGSGGELGETLRELRTLYDQSAPRLRVVRERTTVEISPGGMVVAEQGPPE